MAERISVIFQWAIIIIGSILGLITVGFLAWVSDKGFDITDEGFYLLGSQFPSEVKIFVNTAHNYNSIFYYMMSQNVIGLRLVGLFLTVLAAAVFFLGFQRWTEKFRVALSQSSLFTFAEALLICLGAMVYYAMFLPTPSYNSLNGLALTAGSGFFFLALAGLEKLNTKDLRVRLVLFAAGLCIGISFYVKFPTRHIAFCVVCFFLGGVATTGIENTATESRFHSIRLNRLGIVPFHLHSVAHNLVAGFS